MDLPTCTETLRTKVAAAGALGATLMFDCGDDGVVYLDGRAAPGAVDNQRRDADCRVGITLADLGALLAGELNPATGFMMGRLKVSGDMSVALKLQRFV